GSVSVYALLFDENGDLYYSGSQSTSKLYSPGNEDTLEIKYPVKRVDYYGQSEPIETYFVPTTYLLYVNGAQVYED
ncbi:MAG: hypothetical protein IJS80_05480, partial [Lachnospiraceae bacterium]|nr:hypothetical protein [Lachnospiraceae bacterium]